ncbi:hypothetical protein JJE66_37025 [Bradyrhizobium diazoefficiens]|uniref:hypothetical protein n=1 Tax=Bradyrhizobium diazoefficiens TaxID=1355477 RepID=UPI00190B5E8A|nr:hypothetical protein [Bradyrhizobium diazoefficiens]MBK3666798.1 hypothetical protein [Bradyrhizobium diazoefficiens]
MVTLKRSSALSFSDGIGDPTLDDIRVLARSKTEAAINVLSAIMYKESANAFARVAAANAILDRGWGRPVQPLATDGAPIELLQRIERVIVHPNNPSPAVNQIERSTSSPEELR